MSRCGPCKAPPCHAKNFQGKPKFDGGSYHLVFGDSFDFKTYFRSVGVRGLKPIAPPKSCTSVQLLGRWQDRRHNIECALQLEKKVAEAKALLASQPEASIAAAPARPQPAATPAPAAVRPVPVAPPQAPYNPMQARPPPSATAANPGQGTRAAPLSRPHPGMPPAFVRQGDCSLYRVTTCTI